MLRTMAKVKYRTFLPVQFRSVTGSAPAFFTRSGRENNSSVSILGLQS